MAKYTCDLLGIPRDLLYEIEELLKYIKDNPQSRNANERNLREISVDVRLSVFNLC
jgi:hypothetical protein